MAQLLSLSRISARRIGIDAEMDAIDELTAAVDVGWGNGDRQSDCA
jgi:hypothetical protein